MLQSCDVCIVLLFIAIILLGTIIITGVSSNLNKVVSALGRESLEYCVVWECMVVRCTLGIDVVNIHSSLCIVGA